jgi:hypothetical protein
MSSVIQTLGTALGTASAAASAIEQVTISPVNSRTIGSITIDCLIEETYENAVQVTDHPVEAGAEITDHSYVRPVEVTLRCGWSNASAQALAGTIQQVIQSGSLPSSDYVGQVYSQLIALQESRQPFNITTTLGAYNNMLLTSLRVTRDERTRQVLLVTATFREVILVQTQTATVPQTNQANPASTAAVQNTGEVTPAPLNSAPAAGGSLPMTAWTPTIINAL